LVSPVWRETIYKLPGCWQICIHSPPGRNQLHMVNHTGKYAYKMRHMEFKFILWLAKSYNYEKLICKILK